MNEIIQPMMTQLLIGATGAGDKVIKSVGESDFTHPFWSWYVMAIVVIAFAFCILILLTQVLAKTNKPGETELQPHAWDGDLQEYNNPMPRWWVWMFVMTMIFGAAYLVIYPGFGNFKGYASKIFSEPQYKNGWTEQAQYEVEKAKLDATSQPLYTKFAGMSIADLANDKQAMQVGKHLFLNNCAQCHGDGGQGGKGFPNLTDGDWLYGGWPDAIKQTITAGRRGNMPAHAETLGNEGVNNVANYVLSLSGAAHDPVAAARGKEKFGICAACHTAEGKGSLTAGGAGLNTGAPNLTDKIWLHGGDFKTLTETIAKGRNKNIMPSWDCLLGQERIHVLTAYVWQLNRDDNGGVKNPAAAPADMTQASTDNANKLVQARNDAKAKGQSECSAATQLFTAK